MNREQQIYDENTCANIFLTWLAGRQGVEWAFIRAEEKFPELGNKTRWEFVAHRSDSNEEWTALEVEALVFCEGERQLNDWNKLVNRVDKRLEGKLSGNYYLVGGPRCTFDQAQRKTLVDCLERAVQEAAPNLEQGEQEDIGPSIEARFSHWPKDTRKQPTGIDSETVQARFPPYPLLLQKGSGGGNSLGVGVSPFVGYWSEPVLKTDVVDLLEGKGRANAQLGLAKAMGASRTVLLLYDRVDFDAKVVAGAIGNLDTSHLSNMDEIYLVGTFGGEHVKRVWGRS